MKWLYEDTAMLFDGTLVVFETDGTTNFFVSKKIFKKNWVSKFENKDKAVIIVEGMEKDLLSNDKENLPHNN